MFFSLEDMRKDIKGIIYTDLANTERGQPLSLLLIMFISTPVLVTFFWFVFLNYCSIRLTFM